MASITSLTNSGSSTSGLYGNRNVISGLASGMDTESMIENSVSGYKSKITSLQQQMTKLQWKQDAYRGLISQMNNMLNKYTSYTSSTNLFGAAFFRSAVNTVANGANAAKVSATGKSSSDVAINAVKQLAESASYTVDTSDLVSNGSDTSEINWADDDAVKTSAVSGSISIKYGGGANGKGSSFTLRFGEDEVFNSAQEMADAINEQLKSKNITTNDGAKSADNYIQAKVEGDKVVLEDTKGNNFEITGVSGDMAKVFDKGAAEGHKISSKDDFNATNPTSFVNTTSTADYLKDKSIKVTLDGKTKTISLDFADGVQGTKKFKELLQGKLDEAFGKGKITVGRDGEALTFSGVADGSTLKVAGSTTVNKALGLGEGGYSNTLQTSWTLEKALGSSFNWTPGTDAEGNAIKTAEIKINGESITFNSTDTIQNVMDKINGNDKAGVNIKFSSMTGNFAISSKETGADTKIDISGELGAKLFGMDTSKNIQNGTMKAGQDAIFDVTINGESMQLRRATNTVDLDGLKVTLKGTFGEYADQEVNGKFELKDKPEAITFSTTSDSDKIVDAVKSFVDDYNKFITELHSAYSTMPLQDAKGNGYEPLSEEEAAKNTESYNKSYEEKAKTGILFGDSDLAGLYSKLTSAVQGSGGVGQALRSIGLDVSYSNGLTTLTLDEDKLRSALDSDPDKVKDAFTQTTANGASANGLMANVKNIMEQYGNTSIARPGILVNKAGSTLSSYSLSHNELNDQINDLQKQIDKWQDRMGDKIDFYTNQFTQLEMLINQMNSQSSMLMGLTGG